jgi:hypothetical protein
MIKPVLYYTLFRDFGSFGYLAVTKDSAQVLYGRDGSWERNTRKFRTSCFGRFEDVEAAQAALVRVKDARNSFEPQLKIARQTVRDLESQQREAMETAAGGRP